MIETMVDDENLDGQVDQLRKFDAVGFKILSYVQLMGGPQGKEAV